jgi:hypothetical protein
MKIKVAGKEIEIDDAVLAKAIEDKTGLVSIESDLIIRSNEENETFITNLKSEQIKVGKEIGIKEFKKYVGLEVEGKDYGKVADAFKQKVMDESNISIDEKEKKWKTDNETLSNSNRDLLAQVETEKGRATGIEKRYKISNHVSKLIPDNISIPRDDMAMILSSKYDFDISEDGQFLAKDKITGAILQDKNTLSPTPFKEVIGGFFENNQAYLKGVAGGAGGDDSSGTGKTSIDDYTKILNDAGHATNSESFNQEMQKAIESKSVSLED